jgi:hypothetical protein
MTTPSLLNWIMDLLRNDDARDAFHANPQAAMASAGFTAACADDVRDARAFIADNPHVGHKFPAHEDYNHGHHGDHEDHDGGHEINIKNINHNVNNNDNDGGDDDAAGEVQNILNTFVFAPVIVLPADAPVVLPDGDVGSAGDVELGGTITDSTVTDSFNNTDASAGGVVVDQSGSVVGDDQVGRDLTETEIEGDDNVGRDDNSVEVEGDGSAGRDINNTTTTTAGEDAVTAGGDVDETEGGLAALDHTVETGDIHVLSDLVNVDDSLNDSLNGLSALTDFDSLDLADVTGPLL